MTDVYKHIRLGKKCFTLKIVKLNLILQGHRPSHGLMFCFPRFWPHKMKSRVFAALIVEFEWCLHCSMETSWIFWYPVRRKAVPWLSLHQQKQLWVFHISKKHNKTKHVFLFYYASFSKYFSRVLRRISPKHIGGLYYSPKSKRNNLYNII